MSAEAVKINFLLTLAARAIALLARSPSVVLVVSKQNLARSTKAPRSSIFSFNDGSCRFFAVYGSAVLEPVSVLLKDMFLVCWWDDLIESTGCLVSLL